MALIGAGIAATGAVAGAAINASAANSAASKAAAASRNAAALEQGRYDTTRSDLMPYNISGQKALDQYQPLYDETRNNLNSAWDNVQSHIPNPTLESLKNIPGYDFQVAEGKRALENSAAAKGMSVGGNAMRQALNFGTGLANSNWKDLFAANQTQFQDYNQLFANRATQGNTLFSQLSNRGALGESAAAQTGSTGAQLGIAQANNIAGAGQYDAAGTLRAGAGYGNALGGLGYLANNYLQSDAGKKAFGGSGSPFSNTDAATNPYQTASTNPNIGDGGAYYYGGSTAPSVDFKG